MVSLGKSIVYAAVPDTCSRMSSSRATPLYRLPTNGVYRVKSCEAALTKSIKSLWLLAVGVTEGGRMLVGKVMTNSKQRLLVTVEDRKGAKVVDLRSYQILTDGELMPTAEGISFAPEKVDVVIDLLREAQRKISGL